MESRHHFLSQTARAFARVGHIDRGVSDRSAFCALQSAAMLRNRETNAVTFDVHVRLTHRISQRVFKIRPLPYNPCLPNPRNGVRTMIDNEREAYELIEALNEHLPMRAYATLPLVKAVRRQGADIQVNDAVKIDSVLYLGDEGGVACSIGL